MPKISVTKEHRRALDTLFSERDGLDVNTWNILRDLRSRVVAAYDAPKNQAAGLSVEAYLSLAQSILGERLALPPETSRTKSWYGKMGTLIAAAGLTPDTARQLCEYVSGWARRGVSAESMLVKATSWLAQAESDRGNRERGPTTVTEDKLFED